MKLVKSRIATITKNRITLDSRELINLHYPGDDTSYFKAIYKKLNIQYPKFYKMDSLSKLCFLTGEILLSAIDIQKIDPGKIAILIANYSSSVDADLKHLEGIRQKDQYLPSPSIFAYTLPNIMIGELCIRHGITGNCDCFLMEEYDQDFFHAYICQLFNENECEICLSGWVDYRKENFKSELFIVEPDLKASKN